MPCALYSLEGPQRTNSLDQLHREGTGTERARESAVEIGSDDFASLRGSESKAMSLGLEALNSALSCAEAHLGVGALSKSWMRVLLVWFVQLDIAVFNSRIFAGCLSTASTGSSTGLNALKSYDLGFELGYW